MKKGDTMKNKIVLWIMIFFIPIFVNTSPAYGMLAKFNDGDGKNVALDLVESTPENGANGVVLDAQIKLIFNKNVVNMTVKDNNSNCFLLLDANNQVVPIDVFFPDDQIEPDRKREIILKPKEVLTENMTYQVAIEPELQAKNGTSLDRSITFSFTTQVLLPEKIAPQPSEEIPVMTQESLPQPAEEVEKVEMSSPKQGNTVETPPIDNVKVDEIVKKSTEEENSPPKNSETNLDNQNIPTVSAVNVEDTEDATNNLMIYIWAIILVTIATIAFILMKKNNKRQP